MEHHSLDIALVPSEKEPMYINEPWLIDLSLLESPLRKEPEEQPDNIRVYIPMDINREAIMRRLNLYSVKVWGSN